MNHYMVMFFIMILSGLLSTMNVWADKLDDMRLSLNDLYMIFLMTGWMFLFMGLYYKETYIAGIGGLLVLVNLWCIRTQFMVSTKQYIAGMIPHHSMAIHMSKQLLANQTPYISELAKNIIQSQEEEIEYMKSV
jgi:hypothetical protein